MTKEVFIDGIRYVPATESAPTLDDIARGLLRRFWGPCSDEELKRLTTRGDINVLVNDDGQGPTLANVLGDIVQAMKRS